LYQATRQREITQDQVSKTQQTYELAQKKYDAGLIPEVEALQMEVDFADSKNNLFVAETRLKQQSDYFKQLIGLSLDENVQVRTDFAYQTFAIDSMKAIEQGMKNRSELREREIELELSQMSVKEVDSRWQIRGDLSAFYDLSGISATDLVEDDFRSLFNSSITDLKNRPRNKGVVFKLTVPLWDWGVNRAEVAAAKASVETAEYSLAELKKTITREIRSAIDRVKQSENRLEVLKKSEAVAQKSYQISLHRFDNGDITSQELALDQQRLTNARTAYLDAFIAYQLAVADLKRKTMYDFEKGRSLVE
jgi:outer membrane protein TolC